MNLSEASKRIERLEEEIEHLEDHQDYVDIWVSCPHCNGRIRIRGLVKAEKMVELEKE